MRLMFRRFARRRNRRKQTTWMRQKPLRLSMACWILSAGASDAIITIISPRRGSVSRVATTSGFLFAALSEREGTKECQHLSEDKFGRLASGSLSDGHHGSMESEESREVLGRESRHWRLVFGEPSEAEPSKKRMEQTINQLRVEILFVACPLCLYLVCPTQRDSHCGRAAN